MDALHFISNGSKLSGNLYSKHGSEKGSRRPGIIVIGSWLTVKEQMPANYAPLVAEADFAAFTFDFRGFGKSEGAPREVESARSKAEDILNAAAFLKTRPEIDPERIGVLAICASASYTALALQHAKPAASDIKSVAMVAPWIHDDEVVMGLYGGKDGIAARLRKAAAARARYVSTGAVDYIKAASRDDQSAAMCMPGDALDYYLNPKRGAIPEWGARFAEQSWTEWLESDFVSLAANFSLPLQVVTGEKTATPVGVKKFLAALPKKIDAVWAEGTQFDFYDQPASVRPASDHAIAHFRKTLA